MNNYIAIYCLIPTHYLPTGWLYVHVCTLLHVYHTVFIPSATIVVPVGPLELSPPSTLSPPNTTNSTQSGDTTCADREWLCLSVTDVGNVSCDKKIYKITVLI